ncbi:type IV secretion system protein VirB4 [Sporolituus thermophilus DSM 23256]|uniref:Type IV secretion system protein VirB4 n=2 Tax=Sporolituus TaxID=909931 RepID=A0A1G7MHG6_9FIRM|nr:type IV secretion system protein VirB4 [Sporolituus thermophilus DSM 23256]
MYRLPITKRKPGHGHLPDLLPWAMLVAPGIVLNKDGSFLRCAEFRGPDLAAATPAELAAYAARLNLIFSRLGSGWYTFIEARRERIPGYPLAPGDTSCDLYVVLERERQQRLAYSQYRTRYFLTLQYLPPERVDRLSRWLLTTPAKTYSAKRWLKHFQTESSRIFDMLADIVSLRDLGDDDLLTYLHSCISTHHHPVRRLAGVTTFLDCTLSDCDFVAGFAPRLGGQPLKVISVKSLPGQTEPGIFDVLNYLDVEFRYVTRFSHLDRGAAKEAIANYSRKWFAARKSVLDLVREVVTQTETARENQEALRRADDAEEALAALDHTNFGYLTSTIVVTAASDAEADQAAGKILTTLRNAGAVAVEEKMNAVEAWIGSLPGQIYANVRQALVSALNFAHLAPFTSIFTGDAENQHLRGPALMYTRTDSSNPFFLNLHVGDVGHTLIVGPTGSGKSVLLATLAANFMKYPNSQVFYVDKDASSFVATTAASGAFFDLGAANSVYNLNPLAIFSDDDLVFATEWLIDVLQRELARPVTAAEKERIFATLMQLRTMPAQNQNLGVFSALLQDPVLVQALMPYVAGQYAAVFAPRSGAAPARLTVYELGRLYGLPRLVPAVLQVIFRDIQRRLTGVPTLLILDEAWLFLSDSTFSAKIRDWLKTLRKWNAAVVFATQQLSDIATSSIAAAIIENCPTKIFLPNASAMDEYSREFYRAAGLNAREIEILAAAVPKRQYYYRSPAGRRLFELAHGPAALALLAATSATDRQRAGEVLAQTGPGRPFLEFWIREKGGIRYV